MNTQTQQPTDTQLKQTLAKMLPDEIAPLTQDNLVWLKKTVGYRDVLHTEFLHLCWLMEETLTLGQLVDFGCKLASLVQHPINQITPAWYKIAHATWQQRVIALAKVKNIEIV